MQFDTMKDMHFEDPDCIKILKEKAAALFNTIHDHYNQKDIQTRPFVMIKANSGTYGNAVLAIHDINELDQLNKKTKLSMSHVKGSIPTHDLILQEGIASAWSHEQHSAEPVLYACYGEIIGGFIRSHPQQNPSANLNHKGMIFTLGNGKKPLLIRRYISTWLASQFALAASSQEEQA